jgi:hypothetical protein
MGTKVWVVRVIWGVWAVLLAAAVYRMLVPDATQVSPAMAYALIALSILVVVPAIRGLLDAAPPLRGASVVHALSTVAATATIALLSFALGSRLIGNGTAAPPSVIGDVTDPKQFDSLLAYARRIPYDTKTHGTADSAFLTDTEGGVLPKVKAWIAPARGANFVSYASLEGSGRGQGRVVARITVDTGTGRGYPLLNLPPGVSYIWVDRLHIIDTTGTFRALIIPDRPGGQVDTFPSRATFVYLRSRGAFANYPMSRWVLHHSQCFNTGCTSGCCRVCP